MLFLKKYRDRAIPQTPAKRRPSPNKIMDTPGMIPTIVMQETIPNLNVLTADEMRRLDPIKLTRPVTKKKVRVFFEGCASLGKEWCVE
ncbi:hypothetical protein DB43_GL00140 [Parachlamydia acanthamoebae]|jgi:hypothetical protein|nr:hypothetical protein DB43_GL00140 [Parachlamydia acanthamoebae]